MPPVALAANLAVALLLRSHSVWYDPTGDAVDSA